MNYKDTINLPQTSFSMKADLPKKEPIIQKKWEEMNLYGRIRQLRKGCPKYILHDGPPYANGDVHIGTALNKILKDIVVKFKTMQGFDAPFIPGWDCHGLPIEHQVVTQLGDKVQNMSKIELRQECEKYARKFIDIQRKQFKSLGVLADWEQPYLTLMPSYEAAVVEVFADLVDKGFVYRKLKPIHWCISCQTALAEAELVYADKKSPSIYLKFPTEITFAQMLSKILDQQLEDLPVSFLLWTTTPWTLPANVAIALNSDFEYAIIKSNDEYFILASELVEKVMGMLQLSYTVVGKLRGDKLKGLVYKHPLDFKYPCKVILADYVRLEDGTGIVHIAPGHGEEDYMSGLEYNLPIISPVDKTGRFTVEAGIFQDEIVFEANDRICQRLLEKKLLLKQEEIVHSYPHCWRCKKPVIFRATEQWFISIDHNQTRQKALELIKKVKWIPNWGEIRISSMLATRPDWCISRQRTWGVPIPVFYCRNCSTPLVAKKVIDRVKEVFHKEGAGSWYVKPVKEFLPEDTSCPKCGHTDFFKEMDIFDVWFESGASWKVIEEKQLPLPVDLYLEGTDQHRGWFQLSLLPSTMTRGQAPFKCVLTHGFVITEEGEKVSKSKGGLLLADEVTQKIGADIVRLWIASVNFTNDIPVSMKILTEKGEPYRKIRNTFRYLLGNMYDFNPRRDTVKYEDLWEIDKWALSRLNQLIKTVTDAYEEFEFYKAYREIYYFCEVEMSAWYFSILKDRLYTFPKTSLERRSAQTALWEILVNLTKLIAPILVHTAEEIWEFIPDKEAESVHLADWPIANEKYISLELETRWEKFVRLKSEVERQLDKLRKKEIIGNSLEAEVKFFTEDKELKKFLKDYESLLPMVLIVSGVEILDKIPEGAVVGVDFPSLFISVVKSSFQKCERCWNYHPTVGKNFTHPTLCERCVKVVELSK